MRLPYLQVRMEVLEQSAPDWLPVDPAHRVDETWWKPLLGEVSEDFLSDIGFLLKKWPLEALVEAAHITGRKFGPMGTYHYTPAKSRAMYFQGVLRKFAERAAEEEVG